MKEPVIDKDGYPTAETLEIIKNWDYKDKKGIMEFLAEAWYYGDSARQTRDGLWVFATGGWSGNEDLIRALQDNELLWIVLTSINYLHFTGGFYVFAITDESAKLLSEEKHKLTKWCWGE